MQSRRQKSNNLFDFYLLFIASSAYWMTDQLCVVLREFRISIECIFNWSLLYLAQRAMNILYIQYIPVYLYNIPYSVYSPGSFVAQYCALGSLPEKARISDLEISTSLLAAKKEILWRRRRSKPRYSLQTRRNDN